VADAYAEHIFDELRHKPFDRGLLDYFVALASPLGPTCDVGCGPGQVARYLQERGARVSGVDLSSAMVDVARRLNPDIPFQQGTMLALPIPDESLGGVVAFYSIIHIPREHLPGALTEMRRVLTPDGYLLLAFHVGDEDVHLEEWWDRSVSLDFLFFHRDDMERHVSSAGFEIIESVERDPYPEVEHPSRRAYLLARKPPPRA
jgi:SAM-dependent methyltransferase